MIEAKAVVISDPFLAAAPVLAERGVLVLTVADLLAADPIDPAWKPVRTTSRSCS